MAPIFIYKGVFCIKDEKTAQVNIWKSAKVVQIVENIIQKNQHLTISN